MSKLNLINGQKPEFGNLEQIKVLQKAERDIADKKEAAKSWANMNDGERWIDTECQIGWSFWQINNLVKSITAKFADIKSPIDLMIFKATGYDKGLIKQFLITLKGHYKMLIKSYIYLGNTEAELTYQALLDKINVVLNSEYKGVRSVKV